MSHPIIIQGGMGVAVSGWTLARTVSCLGQLGVVSGTALAVVLARRLQLGDPGGAMRYALEKFPIPGVAARILEAYFIPGGKPAGAPFKLIAMPTLQPGAALVELTVAGNFAEVFLAKEGHRGVVGINFLEKIQFPTLPSLYGAILGGVDYVLMGAGIPRTIPGALDRLSKGEPAELKIDVEGALPGEEFTSSFDPQAFWGGPAPSLPRPRFLGIVASATLAMTLARKSNGRVDGFVVEGETAGGHNAPPRGPLQLSATGEPVYGPRDVPDLQKIRDVGLPFWLAGSYGQPEKLAEALRLGAAGIQVGTAFAFCAESGISPEIKREAIRLSRAGTTRVFTDPVASPTGFPFKVLEMEQTLSEAVQYQARTRICDLGYLRHAYRKPDGTLGYRCPAEPVEDYLRKGGTEEQTQGRKCVCNGLSAVVGLGQPLGDRESELALFTTGNDVAHIARFLKPGQQSYTAADVVRILLGHSEQPAGTVAPCDSSSTPLTRPADSPTPSSPAPPKA
ncbi:MAG: nitronate monooxygenase [Verrucomicrobia bacterium]|nr:nitronate monooxygenase [Verrucomicrobiota bacterium]